MAGDEESGFTVVDKRHVDAEGENPPPEAASPAPPEPPPAPMADQDEGPESDEALPHLTVQDRLLMSIDILRQGAWIAMGLIADPNTGTVERDLDEAKIAIDSVAFLVKEIEPKLDAEMRRELKRWVSDLQVNYVRQLNQ